MTGQGGVPGGVPDDLTNAVLGDGVIHELTEVNNFNDQPPVVGFAAGIFDLFGRGCFVIKEPPPLEIFKVEGIILVTPELGIFPGVFSSLAANGGTFVVDETLEKFVDPDDELAVEPGG